MLAFLRVVERGLASPIKVRTCLLVRSCCCLSAGQLHLAKMLNGMGFQVSSLSLRVLVWLSSALSVCIKSREGQKGLSERGE